MNEYLSEFGALIIMIGLVGFLNYHGENNNTKVITGLINLFGLILLVWWIVKFVILGVLIG